MPPKITVTPKGPYVVTGNVPLRRKRQVTTDLGEPVAWESDEPLTTEETYTLCRCGGSKHKPFCDGTHSTRDWDPTTTAPGSTYDDRAKALQGEGMVMRDDRSICEHAGFCSNKASNAWKMVAETGDTEVRSQLTAMIERCPSGALTHRLTAKGPDLEPDLAVTVGLVDDGPLWVTGGVEVTRSDNVAFETRNRVTLCRCGASSNKPLCDGSHAKVGFRDSADSM